MYIYINIYIYNEYIVDWLYISRDTNVMTAIHIHIC